MLKKFWGYNISFSDSWQSNQSDWRSKRNEERFFPLSKSNRIQIKIQKIIMKVGYQRFLIKQLRFRTKHQQELKMFLLLLSIINQFSILLSLLFALLISASLIVDSSEAYHKHHKEGHVKIKVWRGPSHGYKKHKHAPFGYHFEITEKGHWDS